ncbi:hypothetical protein CRP01_41445 [Flavilitoribacter nigricans DSM 23189 = NBRC 102662]|uniref:Sulfatase-modifying factor enzyme-like domain-containing protein n=2 Tax=Flavilitoribacter TaxID=2762562 RepID=A0A2D0MWT2_FLAN2|nr:hypothetical protein CRP01_41445 [Flavilitoribacter nigricans DSM 23189 = NBRC 102662]
MSGNVFEWCWNKYTTYKRRSGSQPESPSPKTNDKAISRGGAWDRDAFKCRCTFRLELPPNRSFIDVGFRVARSVLGSERI